MEKPFLFEERFEASIWAENHPAIKKIRAALERDDREEVYRIWEEEIRPEERKYMTRSVALSQKAIELVTGIKID